ncbi:SIR2 family protein [Janthinobacterium lividum]|uniref:SIR2 family protein n=1 Tax=Janthinobacterium lividum TaxID=29581 RepID=UPI0008938989|nr:SIR2 family protein [Janthinobacterium lividum]MCC7713229.1 SIR2 family protein [Janthinobacterium lividum]OEZ51321.1 hypothetical protein JANLI_52350 [Janthinobacterium lividum]WQE26299.1 SIR2 family protein [Janthinobacterium lividum]STQ97189.1 Uncharacterised protein [Janthinobacterium lividum]
MDTIHDPIRHLRYLRQSLSQDNEAIGFFISAGCPLSVSMPEGKWPLIPDVANLSKFINTQLKDNPEYKILLDELGKAEKNIENIEDILSFLRSLLTVSKGGTVRGLTEINLISLQHEICAEIVKKLNVSLPDKETPYHGLGNWIKSIDRRIAIELFTTNYDILMEQALEDLEIPYFDGFTGSHRSFFDLRAVEDNLIPIHWSRLWKIHGSINWYQQLSAKQRKVFRSSEVRTEITLGEESHLIYPSHLKYEESRKMPYLALIDQLSRFIRRKSSFLILSGYSFSDGHINDAIINALKANPTAMVLGLMFGTFNFDNGEERYPEAYRLAKNQHNLNIWTFDRAIIGTNIGKWINGKNPEDVESEILDFIEKNENDENSNIVKLGDFLKFSHFLKRMIGSRGANHVK